MDIFLYPACTKRGGGLSSLDQNFRVAIACIVPVVLPPLVSKYKRKPGNKGRGTYPIVCLNLANM